MSFKAIGKISVWTELIRTNRTCPRNFWKVHSSLVSTSTGIRDDRREVDVSGVGKVYILHYMEATWRDPVILVNPFEHRQRNLL